MHDLTVIYYSACKIHDSFAEAVRNSLKEVLKWAGSPRLISVTQKPVDFGDNICVGDIGKSIPNVYKQIEEGAKAAFTPYIAMAEDDTLYSFDHFVNRPVEAPFAYNVNRWNLHTRERIFSYRNTPVTGMGIFKREYFLKLMDIRRQYRPSPLKSEGYFGEPGWWDRKHGIPGYSYKTFKTSGPCIVICHRRNLGGRKYLSPTTTHHLPGWGSADSLIKEFYEAGDSIHNG